MSYAEVSYTEFNSCYLQQCHSIDLFSYRTPGHGQKGHVNKVCPSFCSEVFLELALQFFLEPHMVLGAHVVLCMTKPNFLKKMFYPQNGENRPSPGFFECIEKFRFFFLVLYFFISVVYNESLYYRNSFMLEQISYLGKFWFLRYDPKCSWPIRLQDFSINCRTLKLAVSHKEINEINWFLVCPSNSFLRNGSLGFSDFWHNGR